MGARVCTKAALLIYIPVISPTWSCMPVIAWGRCPGRLFQISRRAIALIVSIWPLKPTCEGFLPHQECCDGKRMAEYITRNQILQITYLLLALQVQGQTMHEWLIEKTDIVLITPVFLCMDGTLCIMCSLAKGLWLCVPGIKPVMNWREAITWLSQSWNMTQVDQLLNITAATLMTSTIVYFPRETVGVKW